MLTLRKQKDTVHELTNEKNHQTVGAASDSEIAGFSPVDYLESSVAMCMALTMDAVIQRDNLVVEGYQIEAKVTRDPSLKPKRFSGIDVQITFTGAIDAKVEAKLKKLAHRGCTIGHTIEHGAAINIID